MPEIEATLSALWAEYQSLDARAAECFQRIADAEDALLRLAGPALPDHGGPHQTRLDF